MIQEADIRRIEQAYPQGLTSAQIVKLFQSRNQKLSEATFRKYVQLGLLPRSIRIGQKGKHKGSQGLYPIDTIRRINTIKAMMAMDYTLEDIQQSIFVFKNSVDDIIAAQIRLFEELDGYVGRRSILRQEKTGLRNEIEQLRERALKAMQELYLLAEKIIVVDRKTPDITEVIGPPAGEFQED